MKKSPVSKGNACKGNKQDATPVATGKFQMPAARKALSGGKKKG